tara:strand:- start:57 stop:260 length:204 start_codon:yes stop_codon:yes gene_type:complete
VVAAVVKVLMQLVVLKHGLPGQMELMTPQEQAEPELVEEGVEHLQVVILVVMVVLVSLLSDILILDK